MSWPLPCSPHGQEVALWFGISVEWENTGINYQEFLSIDFILVEVLSIAPLRDTGNPQIIFLIVSTQRAPYASQVKGAAATRAAALMAGI